MPHRNERDLKSNFFLSKMIEMIKFANFNIEIIYFNGNTSLENIWGSPKTPIFVINCMVKYKPSAT